MLCGMGLGLASAQTLLELAAGSSRLLVACLWLAPWVLAGALRCYRARNRGLMLDLLEIWQMVGEQVPGELLAVDSSRAE
eukprot:8673677-Alexandrium_andersonii.AAC.1